MWREARCYTQNMSAFPPSAVARHLALLTATFVAVAMSVTPAASSAPAAALSGPPAIQTPQALQLSAAPVRLVAPADRGQWALRLAGYANDAATALEEILGLEVPAGELRWTPDPAVALQTSASVRLEQTPNGPVVHFNDPFAILAEDQGVAFSTGYASWLMAYALGRLYFADAEDPQAWWTDGAALYLTEVLARRDDGRRPTGTRSRLLAPQSPVGVVSSECQFHFSASGSGFSLVESSPSSAAAASSVFSAGCAFASFSGAASVASSLSASAGWGAGDSSGAGAGSSATGFGSAVFFLAAFLAAFFFAGAFRFEAVGFLSRFSSNSRFFCLRRLPRRWRRRLSFRSFSRI